MPSRFWWGLLIAVMGGVILVGIVTDRGESLPKALLPNHGQAPSFQLTDQTGRPFNSVELKGKVWVADFIFTSCQGSCPQLMDQMSKLQRRLPKEIQLVSFSVDPDRDTPEVLARYASTYQADTSRWSFLTGEKKDVGTLIRDRFRLSLSQTGTPQEPLTHSVRFLLVDKEGFIRGTYLGTDPKKIEKLLKDAEGLLS